MPLEHLPRRPLEHLVPLEHLLYVPLNKQELLWLEVPLEQLLYVPLEGH